MMTKEEYKILLQRHAIRNTRQQSEIGCTGTGTGMLLETFRSRWVGQRGTYNHASLRTHVEIIDPWMHDFCVNNCPWKKMKERDQTNWINDINNWNKN